ncbi:Inosose dehydratase [Microbacterium lemovicicum]|uniref:Inosose dehydratase n=1 Tax=Microbacterium lemovicicum TaxID=1072463 RepID=A0A3S9WBX2_9MICO|nr:sugar phosphate isomerase/epimerase family protein [Microbacterium lemovicicum]AZS37540.1 Inosose dehydratase [Microbacterium lemovicicum]
MKFAYQVNAWGGVVGTPGAVTDISNGFYLTPGGPAPAIAAIAAAGFSGIEIFDGNLLSLGEGKDDFRRLLDEHSVELAGVYSGGHFIYRDAHEDELARFDRSIAVAAEFGARHFVLGGGAIRSTGRQDQDYVVMAELLDQVADRARSAGLVPSYHPHLGSLAEAPEQIDALLAASSIGLCADVAHLAAGGGDPVQIIDTYADRLDYVHLKDYDPQTGSFMPLGEGVVDMDAVVQAVVRTGYSDWVGVELDGYAGDAADAARRSFAYLDDGPLADSSTLPR